MAVIADINPRYDSIESILRPNSTSRTKLYVPGYRRTWVYFSIIWASNLISYLLYMAGMSRKAVSVRRSFSSCSVGTDACNNISRRFCTARFGSHDKETVRVKPSRNPGTSDLTKEHIEQPSKVWGSVSTKQSLVVTGSLRENILLQPTQSAASRHLDSESVREYGICNVL
jgi:hypothetical protein